MRGSEAGDPPPATWLVILDGELEGAAPRGSTRLPAQASDRRVVAAVSAAGRFSRTGLHTRIRPVPAPAPAPNTGDGTAVTLEFLAHRARTA